MKFALVTDLHANREAVAAVMGHAEERGAERFAFIGDFVGYGADPGWVVDLVREHVTRGAIAVMGNHDEAVAHGPRPSMIADARVAVDWTRGQLTAEQLGFLSALPMSTIDGDMLFVHANAYAPSDWGYIAGQADAVRSMQACDRRFTFCGHVHEPRLFHMTSTGKSGVFEPAPDVPIPLSPQRRWLVIPGASGQPRDGDPAACYASFDTQSCTLTFHRVPYDHDTAAAKVRAAGLPEALARRLINGS